jgi:hypothetical protein
MDFDKAKDDIDKWFDSKNTRRNSEYCRYMDKVFKKSIEDSEDVYYYSQSGYSIMANINYPNNK